MNCTLEQRDKLIAAYLRRRLSEKETEDFELHYFSCRDCAEELNLRQQFIQMLPEAKPSPAIRPQSIFHRRPVYWPYLAAAAVLAIAFLLVPRFFDENSAPSSEENFAENSQLESRFDQAAKNSELMISVVSPKIDANLTGKIIFAWQAALDNEPYSGSLELVIMNNRQSDVFRIAVSGNRFQLENKLPPGRYYWTLEHSGTTIYLGKFFVEKRK